MEDGREEKIISILESLTKNLSDAWSELKRHENELMELYKSTSGAFLALIVSIMMLARDLAVNAMAQKVETSVFKQEKAKIDKAFKDFQESYNNIKYAFENSNDIHYIYKLTEDKFLPSLNEFTEKYIKIREKFLEHPEFES
jgi:hypothetical protein